MNPESITLFLLTLIVGGILSINRAMQKQEVHLRRIEIKLDALLKVQGAEWSSLSPKVQALADSGRKIAAIKLHREGNTEMSLAEAKAEVEAIVARKP